MNWYTARGQELRELVRWPSEAVGTGWQSTASEGHRTKPQIVTGCGIDIYPTLLELIGLAPPDGYELPGRSLVATLKQGRDHGRRFAICENPYMLTAIGPRMKLGAWIEQQRDDFPDMLFDRVQDPLELNNLIDDPAVAEAEKELREQMDTWIRQTPNASGRPLEPLRRRG